MGEEAQTAPDAHLVAAVAEFDALPRIIVHRSRPRRGEVFEYRADEDASVFVKTFIGHGQAERVHHLLLALWHGGFGEGGGLRVPEPLAHLPEHNAVVMAAAPGRPASEALQVGGLGVVERAAAWIAQLHATAPSHALHPPADAEQRLERRYAAALAASPDMAQELERWRAELTERTTLAQREDAGERSSVWIHGRFRPEHVFVGDGVTTVIDVDSGVLAEPEADVGELLSRTRAVMARAGRPVAELDHAVVRFLRAYREHGGTSLPRLEYAWTYATLWAAFGAASKLRSAKRLGFYAEELRAIPRLVRAHRA